MAYPQNLICYEHTIVLSMGFAVRSAAAYGLDLKLLKHTAYENL